MRQITRIVDQFKALADMTRLKILKLLVDREYCVCELAAIIDISQPGISQHLRKLKLAGFVTERKEGQWVYYCTDKAALTKFQELFYRFLSTELVAISELNDELNRMKDMEANPVVMACKQKRFVSKIN